MTTPFSSASFPSNPTVPTQAPAGYTTPTTPPSPDTVSPPVSAEQLSSLRGNFIELILRQVVQALTGAFVPGVESAFDQLASWAANLPIIGPLIGPIVAALTGIIDGDLEDLTNWSQGIPSTVVDTVALNPGKFFADAANVTGLTALWVNTIEPFLTKEIGASGVPGMVEQWISGVLGVADNPTGDSRGSLVQSAADMAVSTATDVASQASSATQSTVTRALSSGSPSAVSDSPAGKATQAVVSVVNAATSNASPAWDMPIPQSIAETISNITQGYIQFWFSLPGGAATPHNDFIHVFLPPVKPPNPPAGRPASWHQDLDGTATASAPSTSGSKPSSFSLTDLFSTFQNSTGSTTNYSNESVPIPSWLADFITMITGGAVTFWVSPIDGSWIHLHEPPPDKTASASPSLASAASNVVSNVVSHPAVTAVTDAVSNAFTGGSPTASTPASTVAGLALKAINSVGVNTDPSNAPASPVWDLPVPQSIADFISTITGGYIQFWWSLPGGAATPHNDFVHVFIPPVKPPNPPSGVASSWHQTMSTASTMAATAVKVANSVSVNTDVSTANVSPTWDLPIPQSIADFISNITGGYIQFWFSMPGGASTPHNDWVHVYLPPVKPPNPPAGRAASWHQTAGAAAAAVSAVAAIVSNTTGSTSNSGESLPIPGWLADFITTITGGHVTFWVSPIDGSWIHLNEPPPSSTATPSASPAASIASNIVSSVVAHPAVAAVTKAVTDTANNIAPTKGITGEYSSVVENLLGVFSNPSGSGAGSLAQAVVTLLTGGALSSPDMVNNITSTLVQAFTDAAQVGITQANADISTRFGDSSIGTLLTDIVDLLANPSGAGAGSIPSAVWQAVWKFINCNGLTGKGFTAGNNVTGVVDNPTGSSIGSLVSYVTDLSTTLFSNGGAGLASLGKLAGDLLSGNFWGILWDLGTGGALGLLSQVMTDVMGIVNFFSNPVLPSPTDLTSGAQTAAAAAVGAVAGAVGLGSTTGGLANSVSNVMTDFMGTLGNPNGLGTGNVTLNALDGIPILGPILEALFSGLGGSGTASHNGLLGLLEDIPGIGSLIALLPSLMTGVIGPGSSASLLPDPDFSKQYGIDIQGQGQWAWAWPGKEDVGQSWGGPGCVRTVRPGLTTVYFVTGTWEVLPGVTEILGFSSGGSIQQDPLTMLKQLAADAGDNGVASDNRLDWNNFELIAVPYGAATYPMGETYTEGVQVLTSMINAIPGKFVLIGHSQGGGVISDVYDSLRTGDLEARNDDLVMGVGIGNMRRQKGVGLPGGPVYCPDGEGCFNPLQNTEDRWWEWSIAAGTYPGNGALDGITYDNGDPISCLGSDSTAQQVRKIIGATMAAKSINVINMVEELVQLFTTTGGSTIINGLAATAPHNISPYEVQPFLAQGDTRTFWQYLLDSINALATEPPPAPVRHLLESSIPTTVQPGAIVKAGAWVEWMNVNCTGPAIMVGINCYDANGNLIGVDSSFRDEFGNLIISLVSYAATEYSPDADSDGWQQLIDEFVIPEGTVTARLVFDVEPAAMTTGIVAFDQATFEITSGTIDAGQLGNIGNIPNVPNTNVNGIQGIQDSLQTWQHSMDGLASAFSGTTKTDVAFSELFGSASALTSAATTSLRAIPVIYNRLQAVEAAVGITSPPVYQGPVQVEYKTVGTETYDLPAWMASGDKIDVAVLGGGAGGKDRNGGAPGAWSGQTLVYGTDIPESTTQLTVAVGAPGGAISTFPFIFPTNFGEAGDGESSSVSGTGVTTITASGGAAGASPAASGMGPGSYTISGSALGKTYFGGPTVAAGSVGGGPGGGGGGAPTTPGAVPAPGAPGYVSITAYQQSG